MSGGLDLKIVGGPRHHAVLPVERLAGRHADEPGLSWGLIATGGLATAHDA
jgi:hypothetical protein